MKSLLRFTLLFALIIIGKVAKQPRTADQAAKTLQSAVPAHSTSFFSQPTSDQPRNLKRRQVRLWQDNAPAVSSSVTLE